jgi:hypothetical protein
MFIFESPWPLLLEGSIAAAFWRAETRNEPALATRLLSVLGVEGAAEITGFGSVLTLKNLFRSATSRSNSEALCASGDHENNICGCKMEFARLIECTSNSWVTTVRSRVGDPISIGFLDGDP